MIDSAANEYIANDAVWEPLEKSARTAALFALLGADLKENIRIIVSQAQDILQADLAFYLPAGDNAASAVCTPPLPDNALECLLAWAKRIHTFPDQDKLLFQDREHLPKAFQPGLSLLACMPVQSDSESAGILATGFSTPRVFSPDDHQAARALAGALALQHKMARREGKANIGSLARQMAHDLNNILSGLVSYPELILMQMDEKSPLKDSISLMHDSGIQAAQMVQDFLTLARPPAQQNFYPVCPSDSVNAYYRSTAYTSLTTRFPSIRFSFSVDPSLPHILGSDEFLPKILTALLAHAAQNITDQGEVCTTLTTPAGNGVAVIIEDNGQQIPEEDLDRIFEPFYAKKIMGRTGSGLGLSAVKKLIQDQGGTIHASTVPGRGNRFELFLSAAPKG